MIELQKINTNDESDAWGEDLWTNETNTHVIAQEDGRFYVRDESGTRGKLRTFEEAFAWARIVWGEVTLAPANRLVLDMANGDEADAGRFLLEYLATYGAVGIDVQTLALLAFARLEEE